MVLYQDMQLMDIKLSICCDCSYELHDASKMYYIGYIRFLLIGHKFRFQKKTFDGYELHSLGP